MRCPLCGIVTARITGDDDRLVDCETCGNYAISGRAYHMLDPEASDVLVGLRSPEQLRQCLTWATRRASESGTRLELTEANLGEIASFASEPRGISRKFDSVLRFLGNKSSSFGESVTLRPFHDWPLVFARGYGEFRALLDALVEEFHYAREAGTGSSDVLQKAYVLSPEGWKRFAQLDSKPVESTSAFVAMWFDPSMMPAFDGGFLPALSSLGYDAIRVDRQHYLGKIDDFVVASIRKSALLVADFTGLRTGVFFEAGLALGLGIPVVWCCREDWLDRLGDHFDTRQYNYLAWHDPADLADKLRTRIEATVTERPRPPQEPAE